MDPALVELLANAVKGKGKMIYAILCGRYVLMTCFVCGAGSARRVRRAHLVFVAQQE